MNRLSSRALVVALMIGPATVGAQFRDDQGRSYAPGLENVTYTFAEVTRVDPIYETIRTSIPEEHCNGEVAPGGGDHTGGTVVGALVGAALGNQIGRGGGRDAATVAGAVVGGTIGHSASRNQALASRNCRVVEVVREQRRVAGYDVEYVHQGRAFMSRLPFDPGERVRIRISVVPVLHGADER